MLRAPSPGPGSQLYLPAPALNLYFQSPTSNLYLPVPALNLFLPDLTLNLRLPVLRFTAKVCYIYSVYLYLHYIRLCTYFLGKMWEISKLHLFEISHKRYFRFS